MGPESIARYINPEEVVKRLAAAQGIDILNLVKSAEQLQMQDQQAAQQQQQQTMAEQAGQFAAVDQKAMEAQLQNDPGQTIPPGTEGQDPGAAGDEAGPI